MFQANVIQGGSEAFDALIYHGQPSLSRDWFEQQFQRVSHVVGEHSQRFMDAARDVYESINGNQAMLLARAALDQVKSLFKPNVIQPLWDMDALRTATPVMQRWIMACPEVRDLYNERRCAGFGDTYFDTSPGKNGEDCYDYRRVMDGILHERNDRLVFTHYIEDLLPEDRHLTLREQTDILSTWEIAKMFIQNGKEDPTDPYGGNL